MGDFEAGCRLAAWRCVGISAQSLSCLAMCRYIDSSLSCLGDLIAGGMCIYIYIAICEHFWILGVQEPICEDFWRKMDDFEKTSLKQSNYSNR